MFKVSPIRTHFISNGNLFRDRALICKSDWFGNDYVDQATLKLMEIHMPLLLKCWATGESHHAQSHLIFKQNRTLAEA